MTQDSTAVVGLVHKESVDIAIADGKGARGFGRVGGEAAAVDRAVRKIRSVHISLIDRRHQAPRRVAHGALCTANPLPEMQKTPFAS